MEFFFERNILYNFQAAESGPSGARTEFPPLIYIADAVIWGFIQKL